MKVLYIDKIPVSRVSEKIGILDIVEKSATIKVTADQRPGFDGMFVHNKYKTVKVISVQFDIFERNASLRRQIFDQLLAWADQNKWFELSTGYNQGKHLIATCTKHPDYKAYNPASSLTLEFTSYSPYWYDDYKTTRIITTQAGKAVDVTFALGGSAERCPLCFEITNTSDSVMDTAQVSVNDETIAFENLSLAAGDKLRLGYGDDGLMYIRNGNGSLLSKRTKESSDDLYIIQGTPNQVSITTGTAAEVTLIVRGMYL